MKRNRGEGNCLCDDCIRQYADFAFFIESGLGECESCGEYRILRVVETLGVKPDNELGRPKEPCEILEFKRVHGS
jgi:hypothetical protein